MSGVCPIFTWGKDNAQICALIGATSAPFKVILKTRNERLLLERWLRHYLPMLGGADLEKDGRSPVIVLDNMSTDQEVFGLYEKYADNLLVIRYAGNVDTAHSLQRFQELYRAVWASSRFYALLDTDEFLYLHDGRKLIKDARIVQYLERHPDAAFFPALSLENIYGADDVFIFAKKDLADYYLRGKPLLRSALMRKRLNFPVGHNRDMPACLCADTPLCFVLLHMLRLYPEQRISSNMQKLASFGAIADEKDFRSILEADPAQLPDNYLRGYIEEVQLLLNPAALCEATEAMRKLPQLHLAPDGVLTFRPEESGAVFKAMVNPRKSLFDLPGVGDLEGLRLGAGVEPDMRLGDYLNAAC